MRFPIRAQILLPTSIVMIAVLTLSAAISTWMAQRSARDRIRQRADEVNRILERASFPLTESVLEQMAGLTGAEFVLVGTNGNRLGATLAAIGEAQLPVSTPEDGGLGDLQVIDGVRYYHQVLSLSHVQAGMKLHAFFAAHEYRRVWQRTMLPSIVGIGLALAASLACAYWVGGAVGRSTTGILNQLERISQGHFQPATLPSRDDELKDISAAINQTAQLLAGYEANVRSGERMKTMVAMGAGLAHQIRNSVTGCRMALDIVAEENQLRDQEAMQVARRQLSLMENYLQRFLLLAKVEPNRTADESADLNDIVAKAVALARHSAQHLQVELRWSPNGESLMVSGDVIAIEQSVVNLIFNAIEAASSAAVSAETQIASNAQVNVELRRAGDDRSLIAVADNGVGPTAEQDVFAPFVSQKPGGIGLGLAVVKDVAEEHGGQARWTRQGPWTEFVMELPTKNGGPLGVKRIDC